MAVGGKKKAEDPPQKKGVPDVAPLRTCCGICGMNQLMAHLKKNAAGQLVCRWH